LLAKRRNERATRCSGWHHKPKNVCDQRSLYSRVTETASPPACRAPGSDTTHQRPRRLHPGLIQDIAQGQNPQGGHWPVVGAILKIIVRHLRPAARFTIPYFSAPVQQVGGPGADHCRVMLFRFVWPLQSAEAVGHFVFDALVGFNQLNQSVIALDRQAFIFNGFHQRIFIAAGFFQ